MIDPVRSAWSARRWLLDLVLPPRCSGCGRVGVWLCQACARQLPPFEGALCPRCGRPRSKPALCPICREAPLKANPIRSAYLFEDPLRDAIHALKYRGGRHVADVLAPEMASAWKQQKMETDLLVPVPLYPQREAKRGYNQAALLASALGREIERPTASRALTRVRNTPSQTELDREARRQNVAGAFACADDLDLAGRTVTLVDDVATTGATLDACAEALMAAGAGAVNAFTLARAP